MKIDIRWLGLQVGLPIIVPMLLSWLVIFFWKTLNPDFSPNLGIVTDFTPWSISFYSLGLIGAAFLGRTGSGQRPLGGWLAWCLVIVALLDTIYYAMMVITRHQPDYIAPSDSYYVSIIIMLVSIALCYSARRTT